MWGSDWDKYHNTWLIDYHRYVGILWYVYVGIPHGHYIVVTCNDISRYMCDCNNIRIIGVKLFKDIDCCGISSDSMVEYICMGGGDCWSMGYI